MKENLIYFGNNNPFKHKRGVENVIEFQAQTYKFKKIYYIFFDLEKKLKIFKWGKIICIGIPYGKLKFITLNIITKILCKRKKCLIHSHNPLMSFFLLGKIDLMTVHDGLYYQNKEKNHKFTKIFYFIEKIIYKKTNLIHFISNFSKNKSLFQGKNYIKIFNTTPFESYKKRYKCKKNKVEKTKIEIFTVRSIEERARIDLLIELAKLNKKINIKVAGKGPLLKYYKEIIKNEKIENIELLGYCSDEDVSKNYMNCDIVILTAEHGEGFGLPIIEGYLYNKPVIASNKCAIPEIIYSKLFLFNNNVEDINFILEKNYEEMKKLEENQEFIKYYNTYFSYKEISQRYKELYKKLSDGEKCDKKIN